MLGCSTRNAPVWEREKGRKSLSYDLNGLGLRFTKDFATCPASEELHVNMGRGVRIKRDGGITVKDVLREVGRMFDEKVPDWVAADYGFGYGEFDNEEE